MGRSWIPRRTFRVNCECLSRLTRQWNLFQSTASLLPQRILEFELLGKDTSYVRRGGLRHALGHDYSPGGYRRPHNRKDLVRGVMFQLLYALLI